MVCIHQNMNLKPNVEHTCFSESIADAAAAVRVNISAKIADVERVSREMQRVNQRVDEEHARLTGASLMDVIKPGQQAVETAAAVAGCVEVL